DDLQWADADSLALLRDILRPPNAPPFLLVAIVRSGDAARVGELGGDVSPLLLGGLSPGDARELVTLLAAHAGLPLGADAAAAMGNEAGGHPLFIDEMVRHALTGDVRPTLRLDDALWARVERLPPDERLLVALVATAGAPLWLETAARAADE